MKVILSIFFLLLSHAASAQKKMSFDVTIDKLNFVKPPKGIGKAGTLIFKSASVFNNGIVLNVNNVNNYFDAQIFVRPTFLGFTTQFGNFGFGIEENGLLTTVHQTELINSKFIMDDNQLTLSGESMYFLNDSSNLKLKDFRLYCQNNSLTKAADDVQADVLSSCFKFMTLNGTYLPGNELAYMEYEGIDEGEKTFIKADVKSFDLRQNELLANLPRVITVSNDSYTITASDVVLNCAKDPDLSGLDFEKIKGPCLNKLRINSMKANLNDKKEKSNFDLVVKNIVIQDTILYLTLDSGVLSDSASSTFLSTVLVNCRKNYDTDLFELTDVIQDCVEYGRISIGEVRSNNKLDDKKDSSNKNIAVSVENGAVIIQADVKLLGFNNRVSIYGNVSVDAVKKQLILKVTDTKLPFGLTSVKLLMHFLKKDLISKDITINNNVITISL